MKNKYRLIIYLASCIIIVAIFFIYYELNQKSKSIKIGFENMQECFNGMKLEEIQDVEQDSRIITYSISKEIFKEYSFKRYISGPGKGRRIKMKIFLMSEDRKKCYNIKTFYEGEKDEFNYKFRSIYKKSDVENLEYKLSVYVYDTNLLYISDIKIVK